MNAWIRRVGSFGRGASDLTTGPLCSPLYLGFGFVFLCLVGFGMGFFCLFSLFETRSLLSEFCVLKIYLGFRL